MKERILDIIRDTLGYTVNPDESETMFDLGIDSLEMIELSLSLEDELGIEFTEEEVDNMASASFTLGDLVWMVEGKVQE
jgi:Phosphopantetheine attachment site.